MVRFLLLLILILYLPFALAKGVYQTPEHFINSSFQGDVPDSKVLWLTRTLKPKVTSILGHSPRALRIRYWGKQQRTAWVLEEIGKEQLITVGLVIDQKKLIRVKVLAFRESRGGEVRHPFFTEQFKNVGLTAERKLSKSIDGISGATLSVRALKKLARLALFLHNHTSHANASTSP